MRGLNTSLAGLLFVLLLAGMLLSNVVLMALWQRERVAQRYQMLAHMVRLAAGAAPLSADTGSRVPPVPDDEAVSLRFCLLPAAQTAGTMSQQQLWIALCAYLLVAFIKFRSRLGASILQILRLIQLNLFERRNLEGLFRPEKPKILLNNKQLEMFAI